MAETTVDLECCGPTEPTNPKQDGVFRQKRRKPSLLQLYNVENPIPNEVRDAEEIQKFFTRWNFVPYAGATRYSGQSLLIWYLMLAQLSPTHNACISKKLKYAVGGKATPVNSVDPEWDTGEERVDLSPQQKAEYRDKVKEFIDFEGGISKFHRRLGWSYEATGNAWVEMTYAETMGVRRVHLKVHRVTHVIYWNTAPGQMRVVAVSPIWEETYLTKYEPRSVPIYPNFVKEEDGTFKTMFHLKNGDNTWYGRPESQGSDLYKYREVQDAIYLVKQAASNFTGQLIIEVEDDDPETNEALDEGSAKAAGFDSFSDRFEQNYTQRADDPQSVLVTARPFGSRPMFVYQIKPNTNQDWYKVTGDIAEAKIMQSHGCTPRFMGKEVAGGFSQDVFVSDYVMNMEPVINELKDELTRFSNSAVSAAWIDLLNMPDMNTRSIDFVPPIQSSVDEYRNKSKAVNVAPQQNQTVQNEPDNRV